MNGKSWKILQICLIKKNLLTFAFSVLVALKKITIIYSNLYAIILCLPAASEFSILLRYYVCKMKGIKLLGLHFSSAAFSGAAEAVIASDAKG